MNSGKFPPQPPRGREGEDLPSGKTQASTSGEKPDAFGRFEAVWRWGQGESLRAARATFHRLSESDRESAIQGAPAFQSAMAGRQHPPHASTYLAERKWVFRESYFRPRYEPKFKNGFAAVHEALVNGTFGKNNRDNCPFSDSADFYGEGENIIDLEAVRPEPTPPPTLAAEHAKRVILHPRSQQLESWHAYERRVHGRAKPGLTRPSEWPPGGGLAEPAVGRSPRAATTESSFR
jgi:hypothetical protein